MASGFKKAEFLTACGRAGFKYSFQIVVKETSEYIGYISCYCIYRRAYNSSKESTCEKEMTEYYNSKMSENSASKK